MRRCALWLLAILSLALFLGDVSVAGAKKKCGGLFRQAFTGTSVSFSAVDAAGGSESDVKPDQIQRTVAEDATQPETVKLTQSDSQVVVTIGGKEFTTLHYAKEQRKHYFHPIHGEGGAVLTRPLENPKDHPHHKGLWFSVDEVNKNRHWMERSPIVPQEVKILTAEGNPAKLQIVSHWNGEDGKCLLVETTTVSIFSNRLIIYDATLKADSGPVEIEDTKEGMFAFRFRDELREVSGAKVCNADGLKTTKECWGKESDWVDYHGTLEGKTYGVALFDHPLNFRRSRYHVRDYGLFAISPFGPHAYSNGALPKDPLHIPAGSFLRLRYGAYIHSGTTEEGQVKEIYEQFLKNS